MPLHFRHTLSRTRHTFPDSLDGVRGGRWVSRVCRVYMNYGSAA